jgi:ParB family chromosome partitioning protein
MPKAKIIEFKDVSLDDITIGTGQVRTSDTGEQIQELAKSIEKIGLLQPIMLSPQDENGKYEIILGQRRFLAHKILGKTNIKAAILNQKVDEITAKVISLTENMMRRNLTTKDHIDVCTDLYKKYGSMLNVAKETGLPYDEVRKYVKYDRLSPKLKELYDENKVDLQTAILVNDSITDGPDSEEKAVDLALKMMKMGGDQKKRTAKIISTDSTKSINAAVEEAKQQIRHKVTIIQGQREFNALASYAKSMGQSNEEAAADLVEDALKSGGFLKDEEN